LRHGAIFWAVRRDGSVLLRRRVEKGLLGGMMEFPSTSWRAKPWGPAEAMAAAPLLAKWTALPGLVRHGFTHFELELRVFTGRARANQAGVWCPIDRLSDMALPTLMKKVANHALGKMGA
jgi:A/G-specific adenine glycosylase